MSFVALSSALLIATTLLSTSVHAVHVEADGIIKTIEKLYSFPKQTWRRSGSCPKGTIPIGRVPTGAAEEIANRTDLPFSSYRRRTVTNEKFQANGKLEVHSCRLRCIRAIPRSQRCNPYLEGGSRANGFSMNYLLIASPHDRTFTPIKGKDPPDINNQITVGIAIYPSVLDDDNPTLYIYAINDGGGKSNCINHECGFIQNHNEMGGRVLNTRPGGKHTMTRMGSGMLPSAGLNNAASIAYYMAINNNGGDQVDDPINTVVTNAKCYDVKDFGRDDDRPGFDVAYGGPGGIYCDQ
ncbi:unnamed protein product [Urochloa decumbens]|uniref:Neprosin PEP catalytic domain-containing protein n=1 Tax=Urochloa decumbens TaxID=240449 RepID=A0ABC9GK26_9POAL